MDQRKLILHGTMSIAKLVHHMAKEQLRNIVYGDTLCVEEEIYWDQLSSNWREKALTATPWNLVLSNLTTQTPSALIWRCFEDLTAQASYPPGSHLTRPAEVLPHERLCLKTFYKATVLPWWIAIGHCLSIFLFRYSVWSGILSECNIKMLKLLIDRRLPEILRLEDQKKKKIRLIRMCMITIIKDHGTPLPFIWCMFQHSIKTW